jgi:hypothetical protein
MRLRRDYVAALRTALPIFPVTADVTVRSRDFTLLKIEMITLYNNNDKSKISHASKSPAHERMGNLRARRLPTAKGKKERCRGFSEAARSKFGRKRNHECTNAFYFIVTVAVGWGSRLSSGRAGEEREGKKVGWLCEDRAANKLKAKEGRCRGDAESVRSGVSSSPS